MRFKNPLLADASRPDASSIPATKKTPIMQKSLEQHERRVQQLARGGMSPERARQKLEAWPTKEDEHHIRRIMTEFNLSREAAEERVFRTRWLGL